MRRFVNGDEVELDPTAASVSTMGDRLMVRSERGTHSAVVVTVGDTTWVSYLGHQYRVEKKGKRHAAHHAHSEGELRAPMPGQIVDVQVSEGDPVTKGQTLLILEAMKTQQPFLAPFDGVVESLKVAKGDQVADGQTLIVVEDE